AQVGKCRQQATPSPPNPPLEGEGLFRRALRAAAAQPIFAASCASSLRCSAERLSPSPSRGGPGWGWVSVRAAQVGKCRQQATPSPPNPPLEGEGLFRRVLRAAALLSRSSPPAA